MNIEFKWSPSIIPQEKVDRVEKNIREEIDERALALPAKNLLVHLLPHPLGISLEATAINEDGVALIRITYDLQYPCNRQYFYLRLSCADES